MIGVLAIQGAVTPHLEILKKLNAPAVQVRSADALSQVDRLIIPGGESTTMLKLMKESSLWPALADFGKSKPVWGICAGAILIAEEVTHPTQASLKFMPIKAERNHYGSQRESFSAKIESSTFKSLPSVDFIRAPQLTPLSKSVEILATYDGYPVMLRSGKILASSFHIELTGDSTLHQYFLEI